LFEPDQALAAQDLAARVDRRHDGKWGTWAAGALALQPRSESVGSRHALGCAAVAVPALPGAWLFGRRLLRLQRGAIAGVPATRGGLSLLRAGSDHWTRHDTASRTADRAGPIGCVTDRALHRSDAHGQALTQTGLRRAQAAGLRHAAVIQAQAP